MILGVLTSRSSPLRRVGRRLPSPVRQRARAVASALVGPIGAAEPPSRLRFSIEGEHIVLKFDIRRGKKRPSGVCLWARDGKHWFYSVSGPDTKGMLKARINLRKLIEAHELSGQSADIYLDWRDTKVQPPMLERLGKLDETTRVQPFDQVDINGVRIVLEPTGLGNLTVRFDDSHVYKPKVSYRQIEWRKSGMTLICEVRTFNRPIRDAALVVTGRETQNRSEFPVEFSLDRSAVRRGFGLLSYTMRVDLEFEAIAKGLRDGDSTLDFAVEMITADADQPRRIGLVLPPDRSASDLRSIPITTGGRVDFFVPYLTFRNRRLTFRVERFSAENFRLMRRLQRIGWLLPILKPVRQIWLIGEVPYKAQDNGYQFFRHVRQHHPRRRAYYVIDPDSPDRAKVERLGNVIERFSRDHVLYSFLASRIVGSHHAEYLFVTRDRAISRHFRGVRIFLQHGITATKNVVPNYARQGTVERPTERFVVVSELEQRIVMEDYGYARRQVPIAGFARFDALFSNPVTSDRTILVMPTWRDTIVRTEKFLDSDYFANWHGFLGDSRLQELVNTYGYKVTFVVHPNMRMFADHFDLPGVQLVRQDEVDVQNLLRRSAILVTDYSSVAWDFSFQGRPVVYFLFDLHKLANERAPHVDFDTELPGPVVSSPSRLLDELAAILARGATMAPRYQRRAELFIDNRDVANCERIYSIVEDAWNPLTMWDRLRNSDVVQRRWWSFRRSGDLYFRWVRRLYAVGRLMPRKDSVVFECDRGAHYGDAPRYIYESLIERDHDLRIFWSNNTTQRFPDRNTTKIRRHSPRYYWELSRARYWVNNQNYPADLVKPARTRFLQTWHGTPLKRMQHDVPGMLNRDPGYQERAARLTGYWDVLLSASPYATECFKSAFHYQGDILEVGYPRNDPFFRPDAVERSARVRSRLGLGSDNRRVILYAPTFRDDERKGVHWRHKIELDLERLVSELGDEYVVVVRFHQLVRQSLSKLKLSRDDVLIDGSTYPDVQELLMATDVLITDYSSIFFDFALLQRPMLFFAYDLDKYERSLRGFYMDLIENAPGPVVRTNDALFQALSNLDTVRREYAGRLATFASDYGPASDGRASERVVEAFFGHRYRLESDEALVEDERTATSTLPATG